MKSNLYIKDLSHELSVQHDLSYSHALKAVQFVFTFILSSLLRKFEIKIVSFATFKIGIRNMKLTTLFNSNKEYKVPKRKVLLCKFSSKIIPKLQK